MQSIKELCDIVRQTAYDIHVCLRPFLSAFFAFFRG